jgi:hypothetical protein
MYTQREGKKDGKAEGDRQTDDGNEPSKRVGYGYGTPGGVKDEASAATRPMV